MAGYLVLGLLAAVLAFAAYVRLAPSDPARWHVDLVSLPSVAGGQVALTPLGAAPQITTALNSAAARIEAQGPQEAVLERLDAIALETPRTTRLAGSPAVGRITWVTRSALWGFPDYTTAEALTRDATTSEVTVFARSRFGKGDMGVNAARLQDWLSRL